jgi:hypothetical protein
MATGHFPNTGRLPNTGGSPLTTKGDLFGYSTIQTRVPVGTDGTFLKADSTQTTGVAWAAVSATSNAKVYFMKG